MSPCQANPHWLTHLHLSPSFVRELPGFGEWHYLDPNSKQLPEELLHSGLRGIYEYGVFKEFKEDMRDYGLTPISHFCGPENVVAVYAGRSDDLRRRFITYRPG